MEAPFRVSKLSKLSRAELLAYVATVLSSEQSLREKIQEQENQINWLRRQLFGARSERRILEVLSPAQQLWLGMEMLETPEAPPAPGTSVKNYERAQRKKPTDLVASDSQLRFDSSVPVQEIIVPNPEVAGIPEDQLEVIDERITYRLAQNAGPYVVLKYIQRVVKIKGQPEAELHRGSIAAGIIEGSSADVSFLAGLVIDKFKYHLPLFRQHQRLVQSGVFLARSTLTRLTHRVGELLEPIYHALLSSVLQSQVLTSDETPTPAGRQNGKMKQGYYWGLYGDQDEIAFLFSPTRSAKVLDQALAGFEGVLLSDGYSAYDSFIKRNPQVVAAQCWVHARRNFTDAERLEPEKSTVVIAMIQELYEVEAKVRAGPPVSPDELRRRRQEHSRPIVDRIFEYLKKELARTALLPSNPFVKACEYAISREKELRVFLNDPAVPPDTNHLERALRLQAIGRKNWMFHVTEVGARYGAIFYSLVQSCVLSGVNPTEYLVDVLQRISVHPASEVHLLTPRLWREHFAASPLRSDLAR